MLAAFLYWAVDYVFIHCKYAVILQIHTAYYTVPFGHAGDVEIVEANLLKV